MLAFCVRPKYSPLCGEVVPPDSAPLLRAAVTRAIALGEARGWATWTVSRVTTGVTAVLAGHPDDQPVPLSVVRARTPRGISALRVADVLTDLGVLHDDSHAVDPDLDRSPHWRTVRLLR